jgi:hypothetical protein
MTAQNVTTKALDTAMVDPHERWVHPHYQNCSSVRVNLLLCTQQGAVLLVKGEDDQWRLPVWTFKTIKVLLDCPGFVMKAFFPQQANALVRANETRMSVLGQAIDGDNLDIVMKIPAFRVSDLNLAHMRYVSGLSDLDLLQHVSSLVYQAVLKHGWKQPEEVAAAA